MLGIQLADTRIYREAKEEGRQEGLQQGLQLRTATGGSELSSTVIAAAVGAVGC